MRSGRLRDCPPISQLYSIPLLTKEQEAYYFRKMNYLKFAAARLRDQLDVSRAKSRVMDQIERYLDEAVDTLRHLAGVED